MVSLKNLRPQFLKCLTVGSCFVPTALSERCWLALTCTAFAVSPTYCCLHLAQVSKNITLAVLQLVFCLRVMVSLVAVLVMVSLKTP